MKTIRVWADSTRSVIRSRFLNQYMQLLAGNEAGVVDPYVEDVRPCDMELAIARDDLNHPHPLLFTTADGIQPQAQDTVDCFNPLGVFIPTVEAAQAALEDPNRMRFFKRCYRAHLKYPHSEMLS